MTWHSVLRRANEWHQRQRLVVDLARADKKSTGPGSTWNFACGALPWRGYNFIPLTNVIDLWGEGQAMSSCLYKLRGLCKNASQPSRFFSVQKHGPRHATLELVRDLPGGDMREVDRLDERWRLQDCRLSNNRLPSEDLVNAMTDFASHYSHLDQGASEVVKNTRPPPILRNRLTTSDGLEQSFQWA